MRDVRPSARLNFRPAKTARSSASQDTSASTCGFFPPSAYFPMTAMSERALVYSKDGHPASFSVDSGSASGLPPFTTEPFPSRARAP